MYDVLRFPRKNFTLKKAAQVVENDYKLFKHVDTTKTDYVFLASNDLYGGSFISEIKRYYEGFKMAIRGPRSNLKPSVRKILEQNKGATILSLSVGRSPLSSKFKFIIQWINKTFNHRGAQHDKLFHLFLLCQLNNGKILKVEKNEDINVVESKSTDLNEIINIPFTNNITIDEMLEITRLKIGNKNFYEYNAYTTNCQRFVLDVLESNNVNVPQEIRDFILQDVKSLVPEWAKKITFAVTSLANRGKILIYGKGIINI